MYSDSRLALPADERALVARATAEPAAFAAIYDHYFPRVYNYVRYRVRDAAAADDITAEVFEALWAKLGSYRPERAPFGVWLFAVVRNAVNDFLRASQRRRWLRLDDLREHADGSPPPDQVVQRDETRQELLAALARLGERERDLLALKFAAGMTNRHIAELTGLGESHVGVIVYRSIRRLRRELESRECRDG